MRCRESDLVGEKGFVRGGGKGVEGIVMGVGGKGLEKRDLLVKGTREEKKETGKLSRHSPQFLISSTPRFQAFF